MSISDVININITRGSVSVSSASFSSILIIGPTVSPDTGIASGDRYGTYSSAAEMIEAGWAETAPEYLAAVSAFSQEITVSSLTVGQKAAGDASYSAALTAISAVYSDFYGICCTSRVAADVLSVASWAELNQKYFISASSDADIKSKDLASDSSSIASSVKALGYARTSIFYNSLAAATYPEAALLGKLFPKDPGSYTAEFKTLTTVIADLLTTTEIANIESKNASYYITMGGVDIFKNSKVAEGEWIDVIIFLDWLRVRMTERVFGFLVSNDKIGFSNSGIAIIKSAVSAQLADGVTAKGLKSDPAPEVSAPKAEDVSSTNRGNRILPNVEFTGSVEGAIHATEINGTVSV